MKACTSLAVGAHDRDDFDVHEWLVALRHFHLNTRHGREYALGRHHTNVCSGGPCGGVGPGRCCTMPHLLNSLDNISAMHYAAEDSVLVVEPCCRRRRDEEL